MDRHSVAYKDFTIIQGGKGRQITAPDFCKRIQQHADFMAGQEYARRELRRRQQEQNARRLAYIKQRAGGAVSVLLGAISVPLLDMDATAALLFIPPGLYMMFSRDLLSEYDESEGGKI